MQRYAAAAPHIEIKLNARELLDGDAGKRKFLGAAVRCTGEYMRLPAVYLPPPG